MKFNIQVSKETQEYINLKVEAERTGFMDVEQLEAARQKVVDHAIETMRKFSQTYGFELEDLNNHFNEPDRELKLFYLSKDATAALKLVEEKFAINKDWLKYVIESSTTLNVKLHEHYKEKEDQVMQKLEDYAFMMQSPWLPFAKHPITNKSKLTNMEILGFHPDWIDMDYNEKGVRLCFLQNDAWVSMKWDNEQDYWHAVTSLAAPTHYFHIPLTSHLPGI